MIQPIGDPSVPTIQAPSTLKSSWNSVHNSAIFKFRRQDVFPTSVYQPNIPGLGNDYLSFAFNETDVDGWKVGDYLYIPTLDVIARIVNVYLSVPIGTTRIVTDVPFTNPNGIGYVNNLTYYEGYHMEFRVITYDSFTNEETIHEPFSCYPTQDGIVTMQPHGYAIRELQKINKSTYAFVNWNDRYAWCKYRVEMRERWNGQQSIGDFYPTDANPFAQSQELVLNGDFQTSPSTLYWGATSMFPNVGIYGNELKTTTEMNVYKYAVPTLATPLVAGVVYQLKFGIVTASIPENGYSAGLVTIVDAITLNPIYPNTPNSGQPMYGLISGLYTYTFVPTSNGQQIAFQFNVFTVGSIYFCSIEEFQPPVAVDYTYYYASNSVRQIQSRLGTNMCEHLCVYANIPVAINRGKFISDFVRPTKFKGYPFDIAFIMHESMEGARANSVEQWYDYNGTNPTISSYALIEYSRGEHRLTLKSTFADSDTSVDVWIEADGTILRQYVDVDYVDSGYVQANAPNPPAPRNSILMQVMNIKLDNKCKDNPVYIAWKGRKGGMNYWLFSKTQTIGSTIGSPSKYEPYYDNLFIEGRSSVLTKSDNPTMVVGADNIDLNDMQGLIGLSVSNFVQMYIGDGGKAGKIWQTINVKEGSFKYYETENGRHRVEYTLELVENYVHTL